MTPPEELALNRGSLARAVDHLVEERLPTDQLVELLETQKDHNAVAQALIQRGHTEFVLNNLERFKIGHRLTFLRQTIGSDVDALSIVCKRLGIYVDAWTKDTTKPFTRAKALRLGNFLMASINELMPQIANRRLGREADVGSHPFYGGLEIVLSGQVMHALDEHFPGIKEELDINASLEQFARPDEQAN